MAAAGAHCNHRRKENSHPTEHTKNPFPLLSSRNGVRMNERIVAQNVLVAGIPGSGKTEYCRRLEREKGFLHLDFDELLTGHGTEEKLFPRPPPMNAPTRK